MITFTVLSNERAIYDGPDLMYAVTLCDVTRGSRVRRGNRIIMVQGGMCGDFFIVGGKRTHVDDPDTRHHTGDHKWLLIRMFEYHYCHTGLDSRTGKEKVFFGKQKKEIENG